MASMAEKEREYEVSRVRTGQYAGLKYQPDGKIRGIYPMLRDFDSRWGRLNHRLVRVIDGQWCWTCPTCRRDNVYSPHEPPQAMFARGNKCCELAMRAQFPPERGPDWAALWARIDRHHEESEKHEAEEPVRAGGEGPDRGSHGGGDPSGGPDQGGAQRGEGDGDGGSGGAG